MKANRKPFLDGKAEKHIICLSAKDAAINWSPSGSLKSA